MCQFDVSFVTVTAEEIFVKDTLQTLMILKHCITRGNSCLALKLSLKSSTVLGTEDAGKS